MTRILSEQSALASAPVRHPGIATPVGASPSQHGFNEAVKQIVETGIGVRGSRFDKWVTLREMDQRLMDLGLAGRPDAVPEDGMAIPVVGASGKRTFMSMDAFALRIKATKLYRDLMRRIDDPARFNDLPEQVRALLLPDLATQAAKLGANIRRLDEQVQSEKESLAQTMTQVTAAVAGSAAGVRQVQFAYASLNRAVAGDVTTITARLDGFDGGASTVEVVMSAIADRATGLEAQYTVKVTAGGAMAGFGIAATDVDDTPSSAFIILADKFAIVDSSYAGGLDNTPPAANIMFGVDGSGAYLSGNILCSGSARFEGAYSISGQDYALAANTSGARYGGLYGAAKTGGSYGVGVTGYAPLGTGVYGTSTTREGVWGEVSGTGSTAVGVRGSASLTAIGVLAEHDSTGTALKVSGASIFTGQMVSSLAVGTAPISVTSTTVCTNLNAERWNGISVSVATPASATATLTANKPGSNSGCTWLAFSIGGSTFYSPIWT
jgi:hypothetical protein